MSNETQQKQGVIHHPPGWRSSDDELESWQRTHAQLLKSVADAQAKLLAGINEISDKLLTRQGERIEQLEVQLAGCMTAATGWAKDPPKQGDYGWSPAFQDVLDLRRKYEALLAKPRRRGS